MTADRPPPESPRVSEMGADWPRDSALTLEIVKGSLAARDACIGELGAALASREETIRRLNRRGQLAESAVKEKIRSHPNIGGGLGRILAGAGYNILKRETDATIASLVDALRQTEWGFEGRRCWVCAGWNMSKNGETDRVHTPECPIGLVLTAAEPAARAYRERIAAEEREACALLFDGNVDRLWHGDDIMRAIRVRGSLPAETDK